MWNYPDLLCMILFCVLINFIFGVGDFRQIPLSDDWRSEQPTAKELEAFLKHHKIDVVIRMNVDRENGGLLYAKEKAICKKYGVELKYINAHKGYEKGKGYLSSAAEIYQILNKKRCLIHCKHGFDRTGAMVGYYLSKKGYKKNQIIAHNYWKNYLKIKGNSYKPYYETALYNAR